MRLRLEAVPAEAHALLACVALLGPRARLAVVGGVMAVEQRTFDDLLRAAGAAGVITIDDGVCRFTHELLADAVSSELDDELRAALHDRIADGFQQASRAPGHASDGADRVVAVAHHRLAAVSIRRDPATLADALTACRVAADVLRVGLAYEAASAMLVEAIELHVQLALDVPVALLLDVAHTELVAGNLRAARSWYRRAADATDDAVELATAAVGLGGMWVHEHRSATDNAVVPGSAGTGAPGAR